MFVPTNVCGHLPHYCNTTHLQSCYSIDQQLRISTLNRVCIARVVRYTAGARQRNGGFRQAMIYEIELKAWVEDWAALETMLRATCEFVREFRKSDRYFRSHAGTARDTSFRLRRDNSAAVVTFKEKRPRDGVEYNREREFSVDDAEAFLELVERINCTEYASKIKTGLEFRSDGMTIELVRVDGLGSFLEIEIIEPTSDTVAHERAAMKIRTFLRTTEIGQDRIEEKSYVALLRGEKVGKDGPCAR